MDQDLIQQLNELNRKFYQQHAGSFSGSRSYYWQGWNKLVPYIMELAEKNDNQLTVLDIGCGNGRFGAFLAGQLPELKLSYIGLDNSKELLQIAKMHEVMGYIDASFIEMDVVESLLDNTFAQKISALGADLITALGVLHHIPGNKLRQQFVKNMTTALSDPGYLTFSTWNFLDNKRFQEKVIDPAKFDLNQDELEENDVILNWERGETGYRYCHHTNTQELDKLVKVSNLEEVTRFKADGKSGNLNTYTVLKKET